MKIAMFHHKYCNDGVARVLSQLIPLYRENGNEVILITEEIEPEMDFDLPCGVKRYTIESEYGIVSGSGDLDKRIVELKEIIKKEKPEIFCHHAVSSELLETDIDVLHSLGVKVIGVKHELFSQWMVQGKDILSIQRKCFSMLDGLVVLSECEKTFWKTVGINSAVIPNPIPSIENVQMHKSGDSKIVLWVGRLGEEHKCYGDAIKIISMVKDKIPNMQLHIYGTPDTVSDYIKFNELIESEGVEEYVVYHGYQTDLSEAYSNADVMLVTSTFESFPMNVLESKCYGLPMVIYSMPYLELLKEKKGYIEVEQKNISAASNAIVQILEDKLLKQKLGHEAYESIESFRKIDLYSEWNTLFCEVLNGKQEDIEIDEQLSVLMDTLIYHQSLICQKYQGVMKELHILSEKEKINEIETIMEKSQLKLAIYPSGARAKELKQLLSRNGIVVSRMVDNIKYDNKSVFSLDYMKEKENQNYLYVIASDKGSFAATIRKRLDEYIEKEYQYDWYIK